MGRAPPSGGDAFLDLAIDAVVDRIIIRQGIESRLGESIQLAVKHSDGLVAVLYYDEHPAEKNGNGKLPSNGQTPSALIGSWASSRTCPA